MQVYFSNYLDWYKNPTSEDFINRNVYVRQKSLDEIIPAWLEWKNEDGVVEWKEQQNITLKTKSSNTPNLLKIITNDGIKHFFYRLQPARVVDDSTENETWYETYYVLNKWETYIRDGFNKLVQANPQTSFLEKWADRLLFWWNLDEIVITSPLIVDTLDEVGIRKALSIVLGFNGEYINDYYHVHINDDNVHFSIVPREKPDGEYYFHQTKNFNWTMTQGDSSTNEAQYVLYYEFNFFKQKQFGDIKRNNHLMIREKIADKTETDLYGYNNIPASQNIIFSHFATPTNTHTMTVADLDARYKTRFGNYLAMVCKSSALKIWTKPTADTRNCTSVGDNDIIYVPLNATTLRILNNIINYVAPPYKPGGDNKYLGQEPVPWFVQIDVLDTQSKMTDAFLSDNPTGLTFALIGQQSHRDASQVWQFANIGFEDDNWHEPNGNEGSIIFAKFEANFTHKVLVSSINENGSLESQYKQIIQECINGNYSIDGEPLFLHPEYYKERIIYDNQSYLDISSLLIDYVIDGTKIIDGGLILECNVAFTNTEDMFYTFGMMTNEYNPFWNNTKSNARIDNKRTLAIWGANANSYMNGNAMATYTNYANQEATINNRNNNFAINSITDAFNNIVSGASKGGVAGAVIGGVKSAVDIGQKYMNLEYQNNTTARDYANQITNITSGSSNLVSKAYVSALGVQSGLYTRYAIHLQPWEKKKIFADLLQTSYIYNTVEPFKVYDNRVIFNRIRIDPRLSYNIMLHTLMHNGLYGALEYAKEIIAWLVGGIEIWKTINLQSKWDMSNVENILPPYQGQKSNLSDFIKTTNDYGCLNIDDFDFGIGSLNRGKLIIGIQNLNPNIPQDLIDALTNDTTINWIYQDTIDNLEIICTNKTANYYGSLTFHNLQILHSDDFRNQFKPFICTNGKWPNEFGSDYINKHLTKCQRTMNLTTNGLPNFTFNNDSKTFDCSGKLTNHHLGIGFNYDIPQKNGTYCGVVMWGFWEHDPIHDMGPDHVFKNAIVYDKNRSCQCFFAKEPNVDEFGFTNIISYEFDFSNKKIIIYELASLETYSSSRIYLHDGALSGTIANNYSDLKFTNINRDGLGYYLFSQNKKTMQFSQYSTSPSNDKIIHQWGGSTVNNYQYWFGSGNSRSKFGFNDEFWNTNWDLDQPIFEFYLKNDNGEPPIIIELTLDRQKLA